MITVCPHTKRHAHILALPLVVGLMITAGSRAEAQIPVSDTGPLPRHTVENEHVPSLLDHSNFSLVGRSNPEGPYRPDVRNWTDLFGYAYDGLDPAHQGRLFAYVSTGGFRRRGNFTATHEGGVAVFDVTASTDPVYLGTYRPPCEAPDGQCSFLVRDIEIHDGVGYFSSDRLNGANGGVFAVDLRADPMDPPLLEHLNSTQLQGLDAVHEIGLDVVSPAEAYLYATDSASPGTVSVYDISNPRGGITRITDILGVSTHGVFANNGVLYVAGSLTVSLFDVSDLAAGNVTSLGQFNAPGAFTHSSWPDQYVNAEGELRDVLYLTHEENGTDLQVWDVTDILSGADPNGAQLISTVSNVDLETTQGTGSVTNVHNLFLVDDVLYTSWTAAGMVVIDVSDPERPTIIDTFDTSFAESSSNFVGAFGVNASLGPERILISDRSTGLWVVDATPVPEPSGRWLCCLAVGLIVRLGRSRILPGLE